MPLTAARDGTLIDGGRRVKDKQIILSLLSGIKVREGSAVSHDLSFSCIAQAEPTIPPRPTLILLYLCACAYVHMRVGTCGRPEDDFGHHTSTSYPPWTF